MGAPEIQAFLSYLINDRKVADATHTRALCALLFLYKKLLQIDPGWIDGVHRSNRAPRRPTVLTMQKIDMALSRMEGLHALFVRLLLAPACV